MNPGPSNDINGATGWCPRCGEANPYTALVCAGCGARLPWATPAPRLLQAGVGREEDEGGERVKGNLPGLGSAYALKPTAILTPSPPSSSSSPAAPHLWHGEDDDAPPCPVCGNGQTQLVSALCGAQQWPESQLTSPGYRHRWHPGQAADIKPDAPASTAQTGRAGEHRPGPEASPMTRAPAELERLLAPPPVPAPEHHGAFYAGALLTSGGLLCLPFTFLIGDWVPVLAHAVNFLVDTLCFGVAGVLFLISFLTSAKARARYDAQRKVWEGQMKKWTALRFCARCDNVFHPTTGQAARPTYLRSLL